MTEDASTPILTRQGAIATLRLNRPRHLNRIEPADLAAIAAALSEVEADPDLRVLILTGTGRAFSSGYHLGDLAERSEAAVAEGGAGLSFEEVANRLENLRQPTICRLNGGVYGGATDLALCCDFRIGVTGMEMFMPAARLGIHYYPSGLLRYASRLGVDAAKRLFLTAEKLGAEELLAIGFLTHLVAPEELDQAVATLADRLAAMAPLAVQGMKRALNEIARGTFDATACAERVRATQRSEDLREGLAAYRERRAPLFRGR
ncbi:MAG: enoyl-CoA hydratase/isomerase family protein [Rhodovarius sp.]|nr:enoyl-CoA hydratase/isomerase family protein [Rhodovarius sp.]